MQCPACNEENLPGADQCQNCDLDLAGLDVGTCGVDPRDPVLATPLAELSLIEPLVLSPSATVTEAIALMKERHHGCVFVLDERERLVGVLTEHDVTVRVAAPLRDPGKTRLEEVMTPDPVALRKNDPLSWALHRMGVDGYRHLPVLDGKELIGFLSIRAVLTVLHAD